MPKYARKYKGRRPYKKKRKRAYKATIQKGMVSNQQIVRLKYCDQVPMSGVAGAPVTVLFSANGLYDPYVPVGGHQPLGFDQWMTFYNHYTVIGAKIKVTFVSQGTSPTTQAAYVGVTTSAGTTAQTNLNTIVEHQRSSYKFLSNSNAKGHTIVTRKVGLSKFLGQKVTQEDANAGTVSANPAEEVYFHVWAMPITSSYTISQLVAQVEIDYIVQFHEPKNIAGS